MHNAFGFPPVRFKGLLGFLALLAVVAFAYHRLIRHSIESHPEPVYLAVREHCRYMLGKELDQMDKEMFSARFESCGDFRVKSVAAAGGVLDPVIVKITLEKQDNFPMDEEVFIFKTAAINFNLLSGLYGIATGNWQFNFYNTYSDFIFDTSI